MRNTIFALATSALLAGAVFVGCNNDNNTEVGDMAMTSGDMATKGDMAVTKIGCSGLVDCYGACEMTSGTQAEYDACTAACDKKIKSGADTKYGTALGCGQLYCLGDVDAGTGKCHLSADGSRLTNADGSMIASTDPGTGMKACGACLANATAALFKTACKDTSSPDCNPASCTADVNACLNDKP